MGRLSGPLLDRVDLHVEVPPVEVSELEGGVGESSAVMAARVELARKRAHMRLRKLAGHSHKERAMTNSMISPAQLRLLPAPEDDAREILVRAARMYSLTARTYHRILKISWTIADLEDSTKVRAGHVSEALHYRVGERERVAVY